MHNQATPHQLIHGPKKHGNMTDVMIAYINHLEERCNMFEREMTASHEREMRNEHAEDVQMNDVRNRNTELEIQNRELRRVIAEKGYRMSIEDAETIRLYRQMIETKDKRILELENKLEIQNRKIAKAWEADHDPLSPQGGFDYSRVHPWDMNVGQSAKNPVGLTANQLVDQQQARINDLVAMVEQQTELRKAKALHPWDQNVQPDQNNPLGMTAREIINSYRDTNVAYVEEMRKLREANAALVNLSMDRYCQDAGNWAFDTFGEDYYFNIPERGARLLEEAAEVAQKAGVSSVMVHKIVERAYSRKHGNMDQELGGVIMAWAVMVYALKLCAETVMSTAMKDCLSRRDEIRLKQRAKIADGTSPMQVSEAYAEEEPYGRTRPAPDVVIAEGRDNLKCFTDSTRDGAT